MERFGGQALGRIRCGEILSPKKIFEKKLENFFQKIINYTVSKSLYLVFDCEFTIQKFRAFSYFDFFLSKIKNICEHTGKECKQRIESVYNSKNFVFFFSVIFFLNLKFVLFFLFKLVKQKKFKNRFFFNQKKKDPMFFDKSSSISKGETFLFFCFFHFFVFLKPILFFVL